MRVSATTASTSSAAAANSSGVGDGRCSVTRRAPFPEMLDDDRILRNAHRDLRRRHGRGRKERPIVVRWQELQLDRLYCRALGDEPGCSRELPEIGERVAALSWRLESQQVVGRGLELDCAQQDGVDGLL